MHVRWYRVVRNTAAARILRECGSTLFWQADARPDQISIAAGVWTARPGCGTEGHIFCADKGDYYEIPPEGYQRAQSGMTCHRTTLRFLETEPITVRNKIDLRKLPPLNALKGFEATTRRESVREAAEELCLTHPAVSYQIQVLEQDLGVPLFSRTGGRSCRPRRGALLYKYVRHALESLIEGTEACAHARGHAVAGADVRDCLDPLAGAQAAGVRRDVIRTSACSSAPARSIGISTIRLPTSAWSIAPTPPAPGLSLGSAVRLHARSLCAVRQLAAKLGPAADARATC